MFYIILYVLMTIQFVLGIKLNDFDNSNITIPDVFIFLEIIYVVVFILYITIGHYLWCEYNYKKIVRKRNNEYVRMSSGIVADSLDGLDFGAIGVVSGVIIILVFLGIINGNMQDVVICSPVVVEILIPVYVVKGGLYFNYRTRIKQLANDVSNGYSNCSNICFFESKCYKELFNQRSMVRQWKNRKFIRFFAKNKTYHNIYVVDNFIFVPDILESMLILDEFISVYRIDEKNLFLCNKSISENLTTFIRKNVGSSEIKLKLENSILPLLNCTLQDTGKIGVVRMAENICNRMEKPVEYFYDLIKLCEYLTHYQSLADYEVLHSGYFDEPKEMSFGAFAVTILEVEKSELWRVEEFKDSFKRIKLLFNGREGSLPQRNLAQETRKLIVQMRNRFVGHGHITYQVTEDMVINLIDIICPLLDDFLRYANRMSDEFIGSLKKIEDGGLLICMYENGCGLYLNYESGDTKEIGGIYRFNLEA